MKSDHSSAQPRDTSWSPAFANLYEHRDGHQQQRQTQRDLSLSRHTFTVALSREVGTDDHAVAVEVGNRLHWHVYDDELLELVGRDMGVQKNVLKSVDERQQSWLLETVEAFLSAPKPGNWGPVVTECGYVHHLVKVVMELGSRGDCVIVGRGSAFILPAETTLRVRLVAPASVRITALSQKLNISHRMAARRVQAIDRERTVFVQDHFFRDPTDPQNFDLVLNAAHLSVDERADLIVETLHRMQAHEAQTSP